MSDVLGPKTRNQWYILRYTTPHQYTKEPLSICKRASRLRHTRYRVAGWPRRIGCLIIVGHFPQKEPWNRLYSSLLNHTLKAIGSSQHLMNTACCIWSVSSSLTILVVVFVMQDIVFVTTTIQRHRYRLTFRTPLCCPNGSLVHITIAPVSFPQVYMRLQILPLKGALGTSKRRHPQSAVSVITDPTVAFPHRLRSRTTRTYTYDVHV